MEPDPNEIVICEWAKKCKSSSGCKHHKQHAQNEHCLKSLRCFPDGFDEESRPAACIVVKGKK